jgi:hypothetical protein
MTTPSLTSLAFVSSAIAVCSEPVIDSGAQDVHSSPGVLHASWVRMTSNPGLFLLGVCFLAVVAHQLGERSSNGRLHAFYSFFRNWTPSDQSQERQLRQKHTEALEKVLSLVQEPRSDYITYFENLNQRHGNDLAADIEQGQKRMANLLNLYAGDRILRLRETTHESEKIVWLLEQRIKKVQQRRHCSESRSASATPQDQLQQDAYSRIACKIHEVEKNVEVVKRKAVISNGGGSQPLRGALCKVMEFNQLVDDLCVALLEMDNAIQEYIGRECHEQQLAMNALEAKSQNLAL